MSGHPPWPMADDTLSSDVEWKSSFGMFHVRQNTADADCSGFDQRLVFIKLHSSVPLKKNSSHLRH
jgi:hypothetical protein